MDVEGKMSEEDELTDKERELEKDFERACEREWIEHAEINDVLYHMMTFLPQRCWLVLNDHHSACEVCPLLTVHFLLGIPYDVVERAFAPLRWGAEMTWPSNGGSPIFFRRSDTGDGLKLSYRQGTADSPRAVWLWMDRSGTPPYRGPGDDYPKGHPFRQRPWRLHDRATRGEILKAIESGDMYGCRGVPEDGWVSLTDHVEQDTHPDRPGDVPDSPAAPAGDDEEEPATKKARTSEEADDAVYTGTNAVPLCDGRVLHVDVAPGEVANRIVTVGTKSRAAILAAHLDDPTSTNPSPRFFRESSRGFTVHTGTFRGVPLSIVAIGMGTAMMDFLVREVRNVTSGPLLIVRFGTCGGLAADVDAGSVVVATEGSIFVSRDPDAFVDDDKDNKDDGAAAASSSSSSSPLPRPPPYRVSRPVRPDAPLSTAVVSSLEAALRPSSSTSYSSSSDASTGEAAAAAEAAGQRTGVAVGMNATADGFYASQGRPDPHFDDGFDRPLLFAAAESTAGAVNSVSSSSGSGSATTTTTSALEADPSLAVGVAAVERALDPVRLKYGLQPVHPSAPQPQRQQQQTQDDLLGTLMARHPSLRSMEMESFQLLALARGARPLGSIRAAAAAIVVANRPTGQVVDGDTLTRVESEGGRAIMDALAATPLEL